MKKIFNQIALLMLFTACTPVFADANFDAMAKLGLASRYEDGNGETKDEATAVKLYKEVAEAGTFIGLFSLAMKYNEGKIVPQSDKIFNALMILAGKSGKSEDEEISNLRPTDQKAVRSLVTALKIEGNFINALSLAEVEAKIENQKYAGANIYEKKLLVLAEQGDVKAQTSLGWLYKIHPDKVPTDYKKSVYWFSKAVNQGDASAQSALGGMYEEGKGVEKDYSEAFRLYLLAAKQGETSAQIFLGRLYREGRGTKKDYQQSMLWLRSAAIRTLGTDAWVILGEMYEAGQGVPTNKVIAYALYKLSADFYQYDNPATLHEKRLKKLLNLAEVATGGKLKSDIFMAKKPNGFLETLDKAAKNPDLINPTLTAEVGDYYSGYFGGQDYSTALKILAPLAENGDAHAQYSMGRLNEAGEALPKNKELAVSWYRKSAMQGYTEAQGRLGSLYEAGDGVEKNYKEAFDWYLKSANQGGVAYQRLLADMYAKGLGVQQSFEKAEEWYLKAINAEHNYWRNSARNNLTDLYVSGLKKPKDYAKAIELYRLAASNGESASQLNLAKLYASGTNLPKNFKISHALSQLATDSYNKEVKEKAIEFRDNVASQFSQSDTLIVTNLWRSFKKTLGEYSNVEPENAALFLKLLDEVAEIK
jgi:uncharacterized protein